MKIFKCRFNPRSGRSLKATLLSVLYPVLTVWLCAAQNESVAISAMAVPAYVRPIEADGKPRPESYVFSEGKFIGSPTADAGQAQVKFADIIKMLAQDLAKQNYFPSTDVPSANILLKVYWGTTTTYVDPMRDINMERTNEALSDYSANADESGNADPGALNAAIADQRNAGSSALGAIARNATLLGYQPTLAKEQSKIFSSAEEQTMNEELNEERYFIVIIAYDFQAMQKEHKSRRLWTTRLSVRSPGNKFTEALPMLARAGSDVFGRQIDGLVRVKVPARSGSVKLHELQILGTVENVPASKPGK